MSGKLPGSPAWLTVPSGLLPCLLIRNLLYVPGDATTTVANLIEHEGLARLSVAPSTAAFGLVNVVGILAICPCDRRCVLDYWLPADPFSAEQNVRG